MILNAEKLVADYLRAHEDFGELETRVVAKTPGEQDSSWVRLTLLDAPDATGTHDHLIAYLLQCDCYAARAGGQPEAMLLGQTTRAALREMPDHSFEEAVVTEVRFVGMLRLPDVDLEPARERVVLTANVWAHPADPSS